VRLASNIFKLKHHRPRMMFDTIFFLSGDSYPLTPHIEPALFNRLGSLASRLIGQGELLHLTQADSFNADIEHRLAMLDRVLPAGEGARRTILIGRSSGARVATLFAARREVAAVICLGYPFREPNRQLDTGRFVHLAQTRTPTLILQGVEDAYGGIDLTENYPLSPSVRVRFLNGQHELHLSPKDWDAAAERIGAFCRSVAEGQPADQDPFDEGFYLRRHQDVADAVAKGDFISGEDHFLKHGSRERRIFRLTPGINP
jgi:pimeloyl-ACP methyl ester carboxylesterase